ncbi:MAG: formylglycine-generating enzyme family protein [Chloracidobacterium sp.]|nr:formylglycine-generating enzyme family protein [Chloracidobacterium sp.]MDW8217285.1 formylglycine-generating enzyme family protein [Acidobacteriota bacterium]
MAVKWGRLCSGVWLAVVIAAFWWAALWPVARRVGAWGAAPQEAKRLLRRGKTDERQVVLVIENGAYQAARPLAGGRTGQVWESPAGIRLVWIPPGEFVMGSNNGDDDEKPVHRVRITRGFWLGETEVTQRQWEAVMGKNPSVFKDCPACPVENVSWEDCQRFVSELNTRYPVGGGLVWRLPHEAEWEYACRAGTRGDYYSGDGEALLGALGWYWENSGGRTHPVKRLRANGWGLYDMHGNVWEWCEDWYGKDYYRISPVDDPRGPGSGEERVLRGGSWSSSAGRCRAAHRLFVAPLKRSNSLGLRVVVGAP